MSNRFTSPTIARTPRQLGRCLLLHALLLLACTTSVLGEELAGQKAACLVRIDGLAEEIYRESVLRQGAEKELTVLENDCRKTSADDAAFQMETSLRHAGFPFATVDYQIGDDPHGANVVFHIAIGPKTVIKSLHLTGNNHFSTQELLAFLGVAGHHTFAEADPLFVESRLRGGLMEIKNFYYNQGFLDILIASPQITFSSDRSEAAIEIAITEGVGYHIIQIETSGDRLEATEGQLESLRQEFLHTPFFPRKRLQISHRIENMYADSGYPDVKVTLTEDKDKNSGNVSIHAAIVGGERIRIGAIRITGAEKTQHSFIKSRLKLAPGDLFSQEAKKESFRFLYASGLFSRVAIDLDAKKDESDARDLLVEVVEKPSREVYVEPGWGSYELLRVGIGYSDKNLFGTGRILNVDTRTTLKGENFQTSFLDPWFLGTDITANFPLYYHRREDPGFTRQEIGSSLLFTKNLSHSLSLTAGYQFKSTDLLSVDVDAVLAQEDAETKYNVGSISSKLVQDTRNDIFFPTSGYRASVALEFADQYLGGGVNYYRLSMGYRFFRNIMTDVVMAFRYDTGLTLPAREQNAIPLGERFFNGGDNTVRSYQESELGPQDQDGDPTGGLAFNVINIEARKRLTENVSTSFFVDFGNISPNRSLSEDKVVGSRGRDELIDTTFSQYFQDFHSGIGMGLQYLLPVGPARLDLAFNPNRQEERDERDILLHFTLGMAF